MSRRNQPPLGVAISASILILACLPTVPAIAQSDKEAEVEYLPGISVTEEGQAEEASGPAAGYTARRTGSATKTDTPIAETTQSISVVTREQMDAREVQSVSQAISYTAGVMASAAGGEGSYWEYTKIRGFDAWDTFRDGLPSGTAGATTYLRAEPYGLERVEVLRGPSSVMYGQVAPGGVINSVSKKPTNKPMREVGLSIGSYDKRKVFGDFSDEINTDGSARYRLTGLVQDSSMIMDSARADRVFLAPSLEFELSRNTDLTILGNYQRDQWSTNGVAPTYSPNFIANVGTLTGGLITELNEIPRSLNTGRPGTDLMDSSYMSLGYQLEHRKNQGNLVLRQNVRIEKMDYEYNRAILKDIIVSGTVPPALPVLVSMYGDRREDATRLNADQNAEFLFESNGIEQRVLTGLDVSFRRYNFKNNYNYDDDVLFMPDAPTYTAAPPLDKVTSENDTDLSQIGLYVQDQLKIRDRFIFNGALRHDWTRRRRNVIVPSPSQESQKDKAFSGNLGAMVLMSSGVSPYFSYSASFEPTIGEDEVTGSALKPTTGRQYEVGVKWQPPTGKTNFVVSAFDLLLQNDTGTTPEGLYTQIGETAIKGLELEVSSAPFEGMKLNASYTFIDSEIQKHTNPELQGSQKSGVPRHSASMFAAYELQSGPAQGLLFGAGLRYVGETVNRQPDLLDSSLYTNYSSSAYSIADVKLGYNLNQWDISLSVSNIFDRDDKIVCDDTTCARPDPREVLATVRYNW